MGYTRAELDSFRGRTIPDLVGPGLKLLFVGINPGLWTAATGTPFARPGNRFYPALLAAGILDVMPNYASGFSPQERAAFLARGLGVSSLVRRATARADELSRDELRAGAIRLRADVASWKPRVVAILGITAYRQAFDLPKAVPGRQTERFEGAQLWVVPNPSGLNAHDTVASLSEAYAAPARAAGILS
ncbi:MAG: mismatch-specific DNA-glycosylase [Pseudolysinimonas sp.]